MSMTVVWTAVAATGAAGVGGTFTSVGAAAGALDVVVAGVAVAVVEVVSGGFGGTGFFASSGKIAGASHDQRTSTPIERRIATKMRFSMSGDGVPTSRIERVTAAEAADAHPDAAGG